MKYAKHCPLLFSQQIFSGNFQNKQEKKNEQKQKNRMLEEMVESVCPVLESPRSLIYSTMCKDPI